MLIVLIALTAAPAAHLVIATGAARPHASEAAARRRLAQIVRLTPDPQAGKALFQRCAPCHEATDPDLPRGWVPRIAGQHPRVIAKELLDYRDGLRWDARMEAVARTHILATNQAIADLAAYAGTAPPPEVVATGSGEHLGQGQLRYQRLCLACHGPAGVGSNAHIVPRLGGQDYDYLLRQLHDALEGRRPTLSGTHARLLEPLDAGELEGLADYLSRSTFVQAPLSTMTALQAPVSGGHRDAAGPDAPRPECAMTGQMPADVQLQASVDGWGSAPLLIAGSQVTRTAGDAPPALAAMSAAKLFSYP